MSISSTAAQSIAIALCNRRVLALEQQCRVLAAEVDRMRPVIEAACVLSRSLRRHEPASWSGTEEALERAVTNYEANESKCIRQ